ncbi:putative integral membrane protein [Kalaharituber pfeilii]|nr:putative integral membrane protein [Kalaharituber pfeilii]
MSYRGSPSKHPLQRYHSPSKSFSAAFHVIGICSFSFSFYCLYMYPNELSLGFGWNFKFLTIIGLALSTLTFALAFLADLATSNRLFKWKNLCSLVTTPLEVVIAILYWGISMYDPEAVVPAHLKRPLLQDLSFHLFPALLLMVDLLLLSPPWTITIVEAGGISSLIAGAYWVWTEECYKRNGWYPYPLFAMLNTQQRAMVFAASALTFTISSLCLKRLYDVFNRKVKEEVKKLL